MFKTFLEVLREQLPGPVGFRAARTAIAARRMLTSQRALPHFLICGVQRGGSSSLYESLIQHPQILPSILKEVHFFDLRYDHGLDWYRGYFPRIRELEKRGAITGEASPYYGFHPHALSRIKETLPNVKLIYIFRDPVKRAIGQYYYEVNRGLEKRSLHDAFEQERQMVERERIAFQRDPSHVSRDYRIHSYTTTGIYIDQVRRAKKLFLDSQLNFIRAKDFFNEPKRHLGNLFAWLGVDPAPAESIEPHHNKGKYDAAAVDPSFVESLREYFAPHNDALCKELGWPASW